MEENIINLIQGKIRTEINKKEKNIEELAGLFLMAKRLTENKIF
jgi:hypothetical protein